MIITHNLLAKQQSRSYDSLFSLEANILHYFYSTRLNEIVVVLTMTQVQPVHCHCNMFKYIRLFLI